MQAPDEGPAFVSAKDEAFAEAGTFNFITTFDAIQPENEKGNLAPGPGSLIPSAAFSLLSRRLLWFHGQKRKPMDVE